MGFRKETRSEVSWCHALPCDASAAVADLSENYVQMRKCEWRPKKNLHRKLAEFSVQMRMETKTQRKGVYHKLIEFSAGLLFHSIKWGHPKIVTPEASRPP